MSNFLRRPGVRPGLALLLIAVAAVRCGPSSNASVADATEQIAAAVQAAPTEFKEGARIIGFAPDGTTVDLRPGTNDLVCLSDDPTEEGWSVACYHASLEPYMAMGRQLRSEGVTDSGEILTRRNAAADAKTLAMPTQPATLYVMTGEAFDATAGVVTKPYMRWVVYTPYATAETTGLATSPEYAGQPWVMFPGTASAHIMISPPEAE